MFDEFLYISDDACIFLAVTESRRGAGFLRGKGTKLESGSLGHSTYRMKTVKNHMGNKMEDQMETGFMGGCT